MVYAKQFKLLSVLTQFLHKVNVLLVNDLDVDAQLDAVVVAHPGDDVE